MKELREDFDAVMRSDVAIALILILASFYVFYETAFYPDSLIAGAPGPAFFPRVLAAALILLSTVLVLRALRPPTRERPPGTEKRRPGTRQRWKGARQRRKVRSGGTWKVGVVLALIILFLVLLEHGDFFLLLPLLLASMMVVMGERRVQLVLAVPLAFDFFVYWVFYRLFGVLLPTVYF